MKAPRRVWPHRKRFAFTIVDDTDYATRERIESVYDLLRDLGLRTTKTVWVFPSPEDKRWGGADTLQDRSYRDFVLGLQRGGFEIALHGVRGTSTTREVIARGLEQFAEIVGHDPKLHANHSQNADNLYWGGARMPRWRRDLRLYRALAPASEGHEETSPYFWGDLCRARIKYVRGTTYRNTNTLACDPYMPYHDPQFPYVNAWFSATGAADAADFKNAISRRALDRLDDEGGLCILYTHFGHDSFVRSDGRVDPDVESLLRALAARDGWFRPAGEILDFLAAGSVHRLTRPQRLRLAVAKRLHGYRDPE
jgi:hypothetical protein